MKKLIIGILALLGAMAILAVLFLALLGLLFGLSTETVPGDVILEADFERPIIEAIPPDPFAELMLEDTQELQDIVDALDSARDDERVHAFVARIGGGRLGLAHIQEIRDAVLRFRESGKPAIAWAETFGEFGPGSGGYYLATAFDEVWLQPTGDVGLTGMLYEIPFVRGTLDKLGVEPQMDQRKQYKNAMNFYTEREFTDAHREAMQVLLDSQFRQMLRGVGQARGMGEEEVRERFDRGPYLGQEAVDAGLVDRLGYRDEVYASVRERVEEEEAELLYLDAYLDRAGGPHSRGATIALIHGYGAVTRGRSTFSPLDGSATMGSDTIAGALRDAAEDPRVRAIVFRVDSPGGSFVGSDTIWRETVRAQQAGKPVIVSMGNLAGSGGYYVAMHADRIVAQPGTITASIGVLAGKLVTRELWNKLGVTWDGVASSEQSTMFTSLREYSAEEWAELQAGLDRVYREFTTKVAEGRGLPLERVLEIAGGRIWTGEDARELGLVDELGGLDVALRLAREEAGIEEDEAIRLKRFPARRSPWEALFGERAKNSDEAALGGALRAVSELRPAVDLLRRLGLWGEPAGTLAMPEPFVSF